MIGSRTPRQLGFVVKDIDAAVRSWTGGFGVGPFYLLRNRTFENFRYRGAPGPAPTVSFAISFAGDIEIELIQQHNDAPSAYLDFLTQGRLGFQHVSEWFDDRKEYDRRYREILADPDFIPVHEGKSSRIDMRFAYFEHRDPEMPMLEISEATLPEIAPFADRLLVECRNWNGKDPMREVVLP